MRRLSSRSSALVVTLAGLLAGPPAALARAEEPEAAAAPTIYKWVDANGIAHYTTELSRVPRSVRGSVRALGSESGSESDATRDTGAARHPPRRRRRSRRPSGTSATRRSPAPRRPLRRPPPGRDDGPRRIAAFDMPPDEAGGEAPAEAGGEAPAAPTQTAAVETPEGTPALSAADRESALRDLDARIAALEADDRRPTRTR